jgi:hypothetical protein
MTTERKTIIHLKERSCTETERWFDCWLSGYGLNIYPQGYEPRLLDSKHAIAWYCEIERIAFAHDIETEQVRENY